jgi:hypothetical protein
VSKKANALVETSAATAAKEIAANLFIVISPKA